MPETTPDNLTHREQAAVWLAAAAPEPLPGEVRAALRDAAADHFAEDRHSYRLLKIVAVTGWLAAAAAVVFAVLPTASPEPVGRVTFAQLTAGQPPDELQVVSLGDAFDGAEAQVAWDAATQRGVLRVRNLPANDAAESQYQLWILDAARPAEDGRNRVDGGVFDAPDADGWQEIVFEAKLPVLDCSGFALTLEPPGGSVVSELGPRLLMITPS